MRALLCNRGGLRLDRVYPDPTPASGEALIQLRLAGICNTDLELMQGYHNFRGVLGHEFVGVVLAAPDSAWVGRRVVGDINAACRVCRTCRAGRHTHCPHRTTLGINGRDGVLADYFCLPLANLYAVPDSVPDNVAVFTEPLAAACEILEQVACAPGQRVVVLGDGKLGLFVAAVLRQAGVDLILAGKHAEKLAIAAAWGISTRLMPSPQSEAADIVIECTGSPTGFAAARSLLRPRGTLVLKSTYHGDLTLDMSSLVVDEITLVGSRCGPIEKALNMLAEGRVDPRPLIAACYRLSDAAAALARAAQPGTLKVLVEA